MLIVDSIRKTYKGGIQAVDGVSFRVESGMVLGILGPNGAGKTTTIRMILNILKPDAGTITFQGKPVQETTKSHIGYLPEERGLYRKSAIGDSLQYFAELKHPQPEAKNIVARWLERFNLGGMEKRKIEELSKGNQQKVQFIAAVLHNPDLLILDEPFSGLDPVNQLLFKDVVQDLRNQGKAIIFCTHQLESAEKICDEIVLYNKGKAVVQGTVEAVKQRFGSNTLRVEFDGDAQFLSSLALVEKAEIFPHYAELVLGEGATLNELLPHMLPHLALHKVERVQPSLLSIFIDIVGHGNVPQDFSTEP
ncbi:MAG: ATP-binding cassette domain-containing protein [Candidatus Kapaibacterium sp.]|nr:MAG: ATP-binding cassette domain-containing protein [Candidatus Kapabacteria bacterium]